MINKFSIGDKVFNMRTTEKGTVKSLYPEINKAIVVTANGVEKADLIDLVPWVDTDDSEDERKKTSLLDKVKAKVFGRSDV